LPETSYCHTAGGTFSMNPLPISKQRLISSYSISSGMESGSSGMAPSLGMRGARTFGKRGDPGGRSAFELA
jgi:hypothetical protein